MTDLPGGPASEPGLPVQDQPAADPRAPPDAQDRVVRLPRAELELTLDRDVDVVADPDGDPELLGQVLAEWKRPGPARQVPGVGDDAGLLVRVSRGTDPDSGEVAGAQAGLGGGLPNRGGHLSRHVLGPAGGRRWPAGLAEHLVRGVHDDGLDLRSPRSIPPRGACESGLTIRDDTRRV